MKEQDIPDGGAPRRTRLRALVGLFGINIRPSNALVVPIAAILLVAACAQQIPPSPNPPSGPPVATVAVDVSRPWTDSGVVVRKGEHYVFWATGESRSLSGTQRVVGPDGLDSSGYFVGPGGLIGRIGEGKPFDIGARTHLIRRRGRRTRRTVVAPPPLEMRNEGVLHFGPRDWKPDRYEGTFSVSFWRLP